MAVFDRLGNHLEDIRGDWVVVHSVVLFEDKVGVRDKSLQVNKLHL